MGFVAKRPSDVYGLTSVTPNHSKIERGAKGVVEGVGREEGKEGVVENWRAYTAAYIHYADDIRIIRFTSTSLSTFAAHTVGQLCARGRVGRGVCLSFYHVLRLYLELRSPFAPDSIARSILLESRARRTEIEISLVGLHEGMLTGLN